MYCEQQKGEEGPGSPSLADFVRRAQNESKIVSRAQTKAVSHKRTFSPVQTAGKKRRDREANVRRSVDQNGLHNLNKFVEENSAAGSHFKSTMVDPNPNSNSNVDHHHHYYSNSRPQNKQKVASKDLSKAHRETTEASNKSEHRRGKSKGASRDQQVQKLSKVYTYGVNPRRVETDYSLMKVLAKQKVGTRKSLKARQQDLVYDSQNQNLFVPLCEVEQQKPPREIQKRQKNSKAQKRRIMSRELQEQETFTSNMRELILSSTADDQLFYKPEEEAPNQVLTPFARQIGDIDFDDQQQSSFEPILPQVISKRDQNYADISKKDSSANRSRTNESLIGQRQPSSLKATKRDMGLLKPKSKIKVLENLYNKPKNTYQNSSFNANRHQQSSQLDKLDKCEMQKAYDDMKDSKQSHDLSFA